MAFRLTHISQHYLEVYYLGRLLFRYVYMPRTPPEESPRPYFHPVKTLGGNTVTLFRPSNQRWHHGLSMTVANLSGENFWGGPTFIRIRNRDYVMQHNQGRQEHRAWDEVRATSDQVQLAERLDWVTFGGERWLDEQRRIAVTDIDPAQGYYQLELSFRLRNVSGRPLVFGSPTPEGRQQVGYGGLFWRGVHSLAKGQIMAANGLEGTAVSGTHAPWLAYIGEHNGDDRRSTLLFIDSPRNPRFPTQWFVRQDAFVGVCFAFLFKQAYTLDPGAELALAYRIVIADGAWTREQIEAFAAADSR